MVERDKKLDQPIEQIDLQIFHNHDIYYLLTNLPQGFERLYKNDSFFGVSLEGTFLEATDDRNKLSFKHHTAKPHLDFITLKPYQKRSGLKKIPGLVIRRECPRIGVPEIIGRILYNK